MAGCVGEMPRRIESWSIQLQSIDPGQIAQSADDMIVIDYSADGSQGRAFTSQQVEAMRCAPGGKRRMLLAYLSIGEAEDYRFYWKRTWTKNPPAWLASENPDWPGNFRVRFWDPQWQDIVYGAPGSYLDAIIEAGFDGVFLDTVDTYQYWQPKRASAGREMAEFVAALAARARERAGCFAVFAQNAEGLMGEQGFRTAITGLSKEDLFYSSDRDGSPNPPKAVAMALRQLEPARDETLPILGLEYARSPSSIAELAAQFDTHGLIGSIGERRLRTLTRSVPASASATTSLTRSRLCAS